MLIEIKCRFNSNVLFSGEFESTKVAVEAAVNAGANLAGANLDGANLVRANLGGANLDGANLGGARLAGANLDGANLDGANLAGAYLVRANLAGANLDGANLAGANLDGANLVRANLDGANLGGARLVRANLDGANLGGARLAGANLDGANLGGVIFAGISGNISCSHELLAQIAVRFDNSLVPVAAMIAGRLVGCWSHYTEAIRTYFGDDTMRRLWMAWSQDESWGVVAKMKEHAWPKPDATPVTRDKP